MHGESETNGIIQISKSLERESEEEKLVLCARYVCALCRKWISL